MRRPGRCRPNCHHAAGARACRPSAASLPRAAARADRGQRPLKLDAVTLGAAGWQGRDAETGAGGRERRRPGHRGAARCRAWRSAAARSPPAAHRGLDPERGDRRRRPALLRAPGLTSSRPGSRCSRPTSARASRCRAPAPSPSSSPSCSTPATSARRAQAARVVVCGGDGAHARQGPHPAALPRAAALGRRHLRRRGRGRATTSARAPASSSRAKPPGWPAC